MNIPQQITISKLRGRKRNFQFDMGTYGTASLLYKNFFCKQAVATINDLKYKFERKGFWKKEVSIEADQSPYTKTHFQCGWGSKFSLRTEDNNTYYFKPIGFWRRTWGWFDATGQKVIEIKSNRLSRKRRGVVAFFQPIRPELLWLMMVGWFQVVYYEDSTAAAAAA
jgi:hypothetical protein